MNVLTVSGSHRLNSHTSRIGEVLKERFLSSLFTKVMTHDLAKLNLPFWDEEVWANTPEWSDRLTPIWEDMNAADAFVFLTPEWSGMATPMLKNYFLFGSQELMGHKPALIVSVSSGLGGSYPIEELRISSYKNTKLCYIPEHVIVRNVEQAFIDEDLEGDEKLSGRFSFCTKLLAQYAQALLSVRSSELDWSRYPYGM
jgi:NAD(P)H-dependent FMN reductase